MKAILLAAGYATRLYPLTLNKPKALLEVNRKAIIDYILDKIAEVDAINEVIVISNHRFIEQFSTWRNSKKYNKEITIIDDGTTNDENKLGAIGDIALVIDNLGIDEDIMILASDNLFTYNLLDFYNFYRKVDGDCIVACRLDKAEELKRMGVVLLDEASKVIDFEEKPENPKSDIAIYAAYIYTRKTLPLIKKYIELGNNTDAPGHFPEWLYKVKDIYAYTFDGLCYDIGTPESYELVKKIFR